MYILYAVDGRPRQVQKLTPIIESSETEFLNKLFEQASAGNTVTIMRKERDGILSGITFRNIEHDRAFIAELIGAIKGQIKFYQ